MIMALFFAAPVLLWLCRSKLPRPQPPCLPGWTKLLLAVCLALAVSCSSRTSPSSPRQAVTPSQAVTSNRPVTPSQPAAHLWSKEDIVKSLQSLSGMGGVITRQNTMEMAPPFYKGTVPFSYIDKAIYLPGGLGSTTIDIPLYHEYPSWRTLFIYTSNMSAIEGLPDGAQTVDIQTGRVLAEAKRVSLVQGQGFEIEERHYGPGDELIFQCTSRISFGTGWKVRETDAKGKKDAEYYFLFPAG
jgi:hypothetical protein